MSSEINCDTELFFERLLLKMVLPRKNNHDFFGFLGRAACLPLGLRGFQSLSMLHANDFFEPWIDLPSPMLRHKNVKYSYKVKCPNLWIGFPKKNLNSCLHALRDNRKFQEEFFENTNYLFKLTFRQYCKYIELTLPLRFPHLLIDIYNFNREAAQPVRICLVYEEYVPYHTPKQSPKGLYPCFYAWVKALVAYRQNTIIRRFPPPLLFIKPDINKLDQEALQIVATILKKAEDKGESKAELRSHERYFWDVPLMLESLQSNHRPKYVGPTQIQAAELILDTKNYPEAVIKNIVRKDPPRRRKLDLLSPITISRLYGLNNPPPDLSDMKAATIHVLLCILFYCGRRARCLLDLKVEDFRFLGNLVEIVIPSSKGKPNENQVLPAHVLFPEKELLFLRRWHEKFNEEAPFMITVSEAWRKKLNKENPALTKIITLLGLDETNRHQKDKNRQQFAYLLSENLRKRDLHPSTHLPRHCFASWWPVRCLVAWHPELIHHPLMQYCKQHVWFHDEMLAKLWNYLQSPQADSTEHVNRFMGHRQWTEFQFSYCRSWALLAALHAELQSPLTGGKGVPSF